MRRNEEKSTSRRDKYAEVQVRVAGSVVVE